MIDERYKYSELTASIIKCAMAVHSASGNGFQEIIYQRALEIEMNLAGISFAREFEMPIFYRDHYAQAINYLEAYNLEVGLLINFGKKSLAFKRLSNNKYKAALK